MINRKALVYLFVANSISGFAQGITMLSVPWYFASVLGRPDLFGKAYATVTFISMFWTFFAGSLVDRYPRKNLFMALNLGGGLVIGSIALAGFLQGSVPSIMAMLAFLCTILIFNIHYPTLYAFGQEVTERQHFSKLSSYIEIQSQISSMLAGAMAAILLSGTQNRHVELLGLDFVLPFEIAPWTLYEVLTLDAITYFLTFLIISRIKYQPLVQREVDRGPITERLRGGLKFLFQRKYLLMFGLATLSVFIVTLVHEFYLLSVYVKNYLQEGAGVYASCQLFYSAGAILAGVFIRHIFRNLRNVDGVIILLSLMTVFLLLAWLVKSVLLIFIFSLVLGLSNAGSRIMRVTYIFNVVPNHVIGRTNSVFSVSHALGRTLFISLFAFPFFLQNGNIVYSYLIFACYVAFAVVVLLLIRNKLEPVLVKGKG